MFLQRVSTVFSGGVPFWEQFLAWFEESVLYELLVYFYETYFSVNFHVYRHVPIGPEDNQSAQILIFGLAIGIILAAILTAYTRTKLGDFLRKLIKNGCLSPENAMTLSELGEFRNSSVRHELSRGVTLKKFVICREETEYREQKNNTITQHNDTINRCDDIENGAEEHTDNTIPDAPKTAKKSFLRSVESFFSGKSADDFQIDFSTAHFYLPDELRYRAEIRFARKGSDWILIPITVVLSILFVALTCYFLPDVVQIMDNIINQMAP